MEIWIGTVRLDLARMDIETSTFATKITDKATRDESIWVSIK